MKAIQAKRPRHKDSNMNNARAGWDVDVSLVTPIGDTWRKRAFRVVNKTEARKVRDGFFDLFNAEVLGIGSESIAVIQDGPTVKELAERCLVEVWPREAPRSVVHYGAKVRRYIVPHLGALKVREVREKTVREFIYSLADLREDEEYALSIETIRHCKATLSSILAFAVTEEIMATNPAGVKIAWQKLKDARGDIKTPKRILTGEEVELFVEGAKGTPIEFMVLFQARMGLRLGEALALTDRAFVRGVCHVRSQIKRRKGQVLKPEPLKTTSSIRDIRVPASITEAIRGHTGAFTVNEAGKWLEPRKAAAYFNKLCEKIGIQLPGRDTTHTFRHTLCSRLLNEFGKPPSVVQRIMGHSTILTTMSFYSHASSDQMADAMMAIEPH